MAERKQSFSDISQKSFVFLGAELIFYISFAHVISLSSAY